MRIFGRIKNQKILDERGATFKEVVTDGIFLDVRENPNHKNQWFEIYYFQSYVWVVVTGENPDRYITMYKSRKLMREFGYA